MANVLNSKTGDPEPESQDGRDVEPAPLLREPREGLPPVVGDAAHLARVVAAFADGAGPVAVDAERASGYRYGQRAYLVQLRRDGAGSALIDPIACPDLGELNAAVDGAEMVLHAAHQDLPCLSEVNLRPARLFDTELAGRLLGYQRVGLGSMVESVLGLRLAKEHSAVDWSVRPLPEDWLRYAALDVEILVELRDALEGELAAAGKLEWAREEFAAVLAAPPKEPRPDPWRRTSGIHRVRNQRALGVVRELWQERDRIARERDISPGRVLPDAAIVEAALAMPRTAPDLTAIKPFTVRLARRYVSTWIKAVNRVRDMAPAELPQPSAPGDGPPPTNRWADRDPAAARRLEATRAAVSAIAERVAMPTENLLQPDAVRRLAWAPPVRPTEAAVAEHLREHNAREWQIGLTSEALTTALRRSMG
ncbi:HRDC domain-containing protein [Marinitenerispora sediminis]|uniref:Ribonuclease D n=1 Tax=Marinitenerispora sediminis TaxID=1931232 RepID=A0A368TB25_9ACTN|nr:ribonuclease D [Marinitenerispora sediminis]RCV52466.1 ribonuclease D [Marinitenerispora sediminis]RCV60219.1 ribonuclease D [Marinitenerispora sediminis]RCV62201.1 ribonuclease D [Marinitenerispora sediminis]